MANTLDYNFISCLIESVRENKCLYDKRDAFYFNKLKKEKAWNEIARICNKNTEEVKQKWKLLREKFVKEKRKLDCPSGSGFCNIEKWQFFDELLFLKDSIAVRRTLCNEENEVNNFDSFCDDFTEEATGNDCSTPAQSKKPRLALENLCSKFNNVVEKVEQSLFVSEETSSDELYMKTMLSLIKDLPLSMKDQFMSKTIAEAFKLRAHVRGE